MSDGLVEDIERAEKDCISEGIAGEDGLKLVVERIVWVVGALWTVVKALH